MASRQKNLLEAFQTAAESKPAPPPSAAAQPIPKPGDARVPGASAAAGAPATSGRPASAEREPVVQSAARATADAYGTDREALAARRAALAKEYGIRSTPPLGVVLAVAIAFALGLAIGRGTASKVAAADAGPTANEPAPNGFVAAPQDGGAAAPRTSIPKSEPSIVPAREDGAPATKAAPTNTSALFDPANAYTVVVATYTTANTDLAWSTYDFLTASGIPAFPPYQVRDKLVVFAGAAPSRAELESLEKRIKGLTYNGNSGQFGDAYRVPISDYVRR